MIAVGAIAIIFNLQEGSSNVRVLISCYQSVPMSFAEACLVYIIEQNPNNMVVILDSDFTIYRKYRNEATSLILASIDL